MNYLHKELYELIKTDETIFDFIQTASLDGLWYWDLEDIENEWMNPKFWTTLGYDPDEMPHKTAAWQDIIHPEDLELATKIVEKHLSDPSYPYDQIVRYQHKKGHTVWIRCRGLAIRTKEGQPIRMLGAHTDITSEKRKEELLIDSNRAAKIGSWEIDMINETNFWSEVTREIHEVGPDYQPELEAGINFYKEGKSREIITRCVEKGMATGEPWDVELQIITAKNKELWVRATGLITFKNGECQRLYGIIQDINDRKLAETKLAKSEELFRQTFDFSAVGMTLINLKGEWIKINSSFCNTLGYTKAALFTKSFRDLVYPTDLEKGIQDLQAFSKGKSASHVGEVRYLHKKGHIIWFTIGISKVLDKNGDTIHFISQYMDITDRKKAELKLEQERAFLHTLKGIGI